MESRTNKMLEPDFGSRAASDFAVRTKPHQSVITKKSLLFFAGVGAGAALALLFAPQSGKVTQRAIVANAHHGATKAAAVGRRIQTQANDILNKSQELVDKGKTLADSGRDRLAQAIAVGKEAYQVSKSAAS